MWPTLSKDVGTSHPWGSSFCKVHRILETQSQHIMTLSGIIDLHC